MTQREVIGRYRGSIIGIAWSFIHPVVMLAVYTFVFSVVFKARWGIGSDNKFEYALILFIGLIMHSLLSECVNRAPNLILSNINYVKKVVFPLEVLPWVAMGTTLFHSAISLLVWSLFFVLTNQTWHLTAFYLPLILLPLVFFTMGLSWFLSSLGVYLRDVGQITGVFTTVLLFLSPIFYPISILPEAYQKIMYFNPLTFIIEQARTVMIHGQAPDWPGMLIAMLVSLFIAWSGFVWFQKTRKGFADVL